MILRIMQKCRKILTKHQKVRVVQLFLMMLVGGCLEMVSVSLILPFAEAVMNPEKLMEYEIVAYLCSAFRIDEARKLLIAMAIALALMYVLKNIYLMWETNVRVKFVYNCMFGVQKRLFSDYLRRPYEYYLSINSGEVLRIINNDTKEAFLLLETLLIFFTEIIVVVMLVLTVFIISPEITIMMAVVVAGTMVVILKFVRPTVQKAGRVYQDGLAKMSKWTLQGIQGIKDLKIAQKENYFEESFGDCGADYIQSVKKYTKWVQMPRFLIEAVSMSMFFIGAAVVIYINNDINSLIPVISAIAMAAIRLLPATSRISTQITDLAYREPMLDKMLENLKSIRNDIYEKGDKTSGKSGRMIGELKHTISADHICYRYPGTDTFVLKDATFEIEKGTSIGIVGVSGAGKTTMVDVILGLLSPESGVINVDGVNIEEDRRGWLSQVGYIPQNIFLLDDTIRQNVAFGVEVSSIDDEGVWYALKEAALEKFVRNLPDGLDTTLGERGVRLSGGQRQRIGIARALYEKPSVLIFDEATSALDGETEMVIMESLKRLQRSKTMIIIAHRLTTIESCDMVYRVENGMVVKER